MCNCYLRANFVAQDDAMAIKTETRRIIRPRLIISTRVYLCMITHTLYNLKRTYRFYNGQRTRFPFGPLSDPFADWIWLDTCFFFRLRGRVGAFLEIRDTRSLLKFTDRYIAIVYPASRRCIPREFSGSALPVSSLHWSLASSRLSLTHPFNPLLRSACFSLSLSLPSALPPFASIFLFPLSSLFFLLVPRYAHTLAVTSRRQHVGEFKHLLLLHFWIVFDL